MLATSVCVLVFNRTFLSGLLFFAVVLLGWPKQQLVIPIMEVCRNTQQTFIKGYVKALK